MSTHLSMSGKGTEALGERLRRLLPIRGDKTLFVVVVGLVLVALVIPPFFFLVQGSVVFTADDGSISVSLQRFVDLVEQRGVAQSTFNSFSFAIGSAILALVIGGIVAWLVERTNTPLKALAYLTTIISLGTPFVLYVSAWLLLLNRSGPVNSLYREITHSTGFLIDVYGLPGMILVEGLLWSPLVFLLLGATLRNFNPELEEAARMSGAGTWSTIRRITLRLSMPSILALALLVFIRALEAFEVPALVGLPGRVHVLATDIYDQMHLTMPPDLGSASALSVLLVVLVSILLYFYARLTRSAERFATITGKNFRPNQLDLGRWRPVGGAVLILNLIVLLVLPATILVWASLLPFYQSIRVAALPLLTLDNYRHVFGSSRYIMLLGNTLIIAFVTATVVMLTGSLTAWLSVRKVKGAAALDQLATMPLVFPGIVLGVGVMQLFLYVPVGIYGTIWIIVWAFAINWMPYGVRYSYAGMLQVHRELEEAAAVAGAEPITGFRRIVIPLLAPSVLAGWLFVFLLSTRVLALPVLLSGPSSQTMAVAMFDLWGNGQGPELAALGLLWSVAMTVIAIVFYLVSRRSGAGEYGRN
jgi:iron(III) transport system permease protein